MKVGQPGVLHRRVELVGTGAGDAELAVLPDDALFAIDQQDAIVRAAVGAGAARSLGLAPGSSGAGHEGQRADALRVVAADDRRCREVGWPFAELPDDPAARLHLDHPIVELIGDQGVAGLVELALVLLGEDGEAESSHRHDSGEAADRGDSVLEVHNPSRDQRNNTTTTRAIGATANSQAFNGNPLLKAARARWTRGNVACSRSSASTAPPDELRKNACSRGAQRSNRRSNERRSPAAYSSISCSSSKRHRLKG